MENEVLAGRFRFDDHEVWEKLTLDGKQSNLYVEAQFDFLKGYDKDYIQGYLEKNSRVTLVKCLLPDWTGLSVGNEGRCNFAEIFPHYIVRGVHFDPNEEVVQEVRFHVTDGEALFPDHLAFGRVAEPDNALREKISERENVNLGEDFELYCFSGGVGIFECDLPFGQLRVLHSSSIKWPSVKGLSVSNRVLFCLVFSMPVKFRAATTKMHSLRRLLGVLAGRPQMIQDLSMIFKELGESTQCEVIETMTPMFRSSSENIGFHSIGMLNGVTEKELTSVVIRHWFETEKDMWDAWLRFNDAFELQNQYSRDRLVAVANLFDLISPKLSKVETGKDKEVMEAIAKSSALFRSLPDGPLRQAALNSLARLNEPNLKKKVSAWNAVLKEKYPDIFGEIDLVTDAAIEVRNLFVHGTKPKLDIGKDDWSLIFLIKTLEFSFISGYMLRLGWDMSEWRRTYAGTFQYFGRFVREYDEGLKLIKGKIELREQSKTKKEYII